jgi:hypothetical protein
MRFLIATSSHREEVIGEPVLIEQVPDEQFAVHRTHIGASSFTPYWTVTHVETGFAAAHGDTIDFAIKLARDRFATKTPKEIKVALTKARAMLPEIVLKPVLQGISDGGVDEEDGDVELDGDWVEKPA